MNFAKHMLKKYKVLYLLFVDLKVFFRSLLRETNHLIETELESGGYSKSMVMLGFSAIKSMTGDISGLLNILFKVKIEIDLE